MGRDSHSSVKIFRRDRFSGVGGNTVPIKEESNNSKGIYPKLIAQFLTVMTGGNRFEHLSWWGHGIEAIKKTFGLT